MPVFTKPRFSPMMPGMPPSGYQRSELVLRMMGEAASSLPPEQRLAAAQAALAVADELYPEEPSTGTGHGPVGVSNG